MLCVATFERLFRRATSLPLHNYKAKTDARVTMQKIKPSTAIKLLCAGWHRKEHTDSFQPWHQSLLPHFQFTTKLRVNCGWQDGENSPRQEAETSVNTGHKACRRYFLVSFQLHIARFLILVLSNLRNHVPPTAVFEIWWGGGVQRNEDFDDEFSM